MVLFLLVSGKLIALVGHHGRDVLLGATVTIEDEVVGSAIVRQREDEYAILIAGGLDAAPAAIYLAIAPGIETWVCVASIVLDGHRVG